MVLTGGPLYSDGLSYVNAISYLVAYNIGFVLFWCWHKFDLSNRLSIELGKVGFTFFWVQIFRTF